MTSRRAFASLCLMNALWGGTYSLTKWTLLFVPPCTLAMIRFFLSGLILAMVSPLKPRDLTKQDWKDLFWVSLLGISLAFMFHYWGIRLTSATKTSIAIALEPIFILALSILVLKEAFHWRVAGAIGVSLFGAILLVAGGKNPEQLSHELFHGGEMMGDLLVIISVVLGSVYTILSKPVVTRLGAIPATSLGFLIGAVLLIPFSLVEYQQGSVIELTVSVVLAILFISTICTAWGYVLWNHCLTQVPASVLGITLYIQPVAGIMSGIFFFGEHLKLLDMTGAFFIFLGVTMAPEKK